MQFFLYGIVVIFRTELRKNKVTSTCFLILDGSEIFCNCLVVLCSICSQLSVGLGIMRCVLSQIESIYFECIIQRKKNGEA